MTNRTIYTLSVDKTGAAYDREFSDLSKAIGVADHEFHTNKANEVTVYHYTNGGANQYVDFHLERNA